MDQTSQYQQKLTIAFSSYSSVDSLLQYRRGRQYADDDDHHDIESKPANDRGVYCIKRLFSERASSMLLPQYLPKVSGQTYRSTIERLFSERRLCMLQPHYR
jgi:hypothetical protein